MVRVFNHLQNQQKSNFEIISNRLPVLALSGKVIVYRDGIALNPFLALETRHDMTIGHRNNFAKVGVCALLLATTVTTKAQSSTTIGGVTGGDAVGIGFAIAAIGAGIGIGVYFAVHHGQSLDGCAVSGSSGLELQNRGDQQTFALVGEVAGIKPGERFRVSGKKQKKTAGAPRQFLVEKVNKDYGACKVAPASP